MLLYPGADQKGPQGSIDFASGNTKSVATYSPQGLSWCGWCRFNTAPSGTYSISIVANGGSIFVGISSAGGGPALTLNDPATTMIASPLGGVWYFLAWTSFATLNTLGYYGTQSSGLTRVDSGSAGTPVGTGTLYLSNNNFSAGNFNGQIAGSKWWTRGLSAKEILAESRQRAPVSPNGLLAYMPLVSAGEGSTDATRKGRLWTKTGSLVYANRSPSVPEVANPRALFFLSQAAASLAFLFPDADPPTRRQIAPAPQSDVLSALVLPVLKTFVPPQADPVRAPATKPAPPSDVLSSIVLAPTLGKLADADPLWRAMARPAIVLDANALVARVSALPTLDVEDTIRIVPSRRPLPADGYGPVDVLTFPTLPSTLGPGEPPARWVPKAPSPADGYGPVDVLTFPVLPSPVGQGDLSPRWVASAPLPDAGPIAARGSVAIPALDFEDTLRRTAPRTFLLEPQGPANALSVAPAISTFVGVDPPAVRFWPIRPVIDQASGLDARSVPASSFLPIDTAVPRAPTTRPVADGAALDAFAPVVSLGSFVPVDGIQVRSAAPRPIQDQASALNTFSALGSWLQPADAVARAPTPRAPTEPGSSLATLVLPAVGTWLGIPDLTVRTVRPPPLFDALVAARVIVISQFLPPSDSPPTIQRPSRTTDPGAVFAAISAALPPAIQFTELAPVARTLRPLLDTHPVGAMPLSFSALQSDGPVAQAARARPLPETSAPSAGSFLLGMVPASDAAPTQRRQATQPDASFVTNATGAVMSSIGWLDPSLAPRTFARATLPDVSVPLWTRIPIPPLLGYIGDDQVLRSWHPASTRTWLTEVVVGGSLVSAGLPFLVVLPATTIAIPLLSTTSVAIPSLSATTIAAAVLPSTNII